MEKFWAGDLTEQVKVLKSKLDSLDSEMEEVERDSEKTLQGLSEEHSKKIQMIKDYGTFHKQFLQSY